jgi:excisionase family DNA binding protein
MKNQPKKTENYPEILTLKEACELLNCHPNTLRNWDNEGTLKAIRFGRRGDRRYRKEDILSIIKKQNHDSKK